MDFKVRTVRVYLWVFLVAGCLGGITSSPTLDEDCELKAVDTMHDFCCDLHEESHQFKECQIDWNHKIQPSQDEEEQVFMFCTAECTFNSSQLLGKNRQSLSMRHVRDHLENEIVNDDDIETMIATYTKCEKHGEGEISSGNTSNPPYHPLFLATTLMNHNGVKKLAQRLSKHGCHPFPGLVFECVANEMILNCPDKRFHKTAQCSETRKYLRQCMEYLKYKA
ncbi:hypothetical protein KR018_006189 [Drosophila ironensis]|nr:hypothetical protein KR018_006189 [Drosophila ironensis]